VDNLARNRLPREIAFHLGPSLSRQSAIIRIRHLPLSFSIPSSKFDEDALVKAWVQTFGRALFTALAYPSGSGRIEIFRADSLAEFLASIVRDLLDGDTSRHWAYAEFSEILGQANPEALLELLCLWPRETLPILVEMERSGRLEKLLLRLDELALERLIGAMSEAEGETRTSGANHEEPSAIRRLAAAAHHVSHDPPRSFRTLKSRRYAVQLCVRANAGTSPSPRRLFESLCALSWLLEHPYALDFPEFDWEWSDLPPTVSALLRKLREDAQSAQPRTLFLGLLQSLTKLRMALAVEVATPLPRERQIVSDWCGIFFLCETLHRLGWVPAWQKLAPFQAGGISCLLAGLALSSTFRFEPDFDSLEPATALFAGYVNEPDLAHCRSVFSSTDPSVRREILLAALGREPAEGETTDWPSALQALSDRLLPEFASRIRGFRKASVRSIVTNFLRCSGHIAVSEDSVRISCQRSPFHVALHIAGIDQPLPSVAWLGNRRLVFNLGEL
jgi:hypothetical protein